MSSSTNNPADDDRRPTDDEPDDDPTLLRPLVSAADVGRAGRVRVQFDHHIGEQLEREASERSPDSSDRHLIGLAGEVATAVWRDTTIDRRIFPDFQGDGGYDLEASVWYRDEPLRVEVKTTQRCDTPESFVSSQKIDLADVFVLCSAPSPTQYVEIVGYIPRPLLAAIGEAYGRDGYLLSPEYLFPVDSVCIDPDGVREVLYRRFRKR